MNEWNNLEDAFKELDKGEYAAIAKALASYRRSLMDEGFTRRETMRLVEAYSDFVYDLTINQVEADREEEWVGDDDVDSSDED